MLEMATYQPSLDYRMLSVKKNKLTMSSRLKAWQKEGADHIKDFTQIMEGSTSLRQVFGEACVMVLKALKNNMQIRILPAGFI